MNISSKAKGRILLATDRLATEQPLHGGIISQWKLVESDCITTMGIGYNRSRLMLVFNPKFVEGIRLEELAAVLCHEVNHCIMNHCEHKPTPDENRKARIIAEEVTVNEWVSGTLPGQPILLADYPSLPPNEDTETRYTKLLAILPPEREAIDDHTLWDKIQASGILASSEIRNTIAQAWAKLTPKQKEKIKLPDNVSKILQNAVLSSASSLSSGTAKVPWQQVLRRYVGRVLSCRPVYNRPNRRFPELVGINPARGRKSSSLHVVAVLDTSGSVTDRMLADFVAELRMIAKKNKVTVIEADDSVRATYRFTGSITSVEGRGGTDFRPAIEEAVAMKPDLLIYATDGMGKAPVHAPKYPVIWLLTEDGQHPCNWGRAVRISS
jgi:predicted metal-dependent peptidase